MLSKWSLNLNKPYMKAIRKAMQVKSHKAKKAKPKKRLMMILLKSLEEKKLKLSNIHLCFKI
jgi:hypothetical protein